MRDEALAGLEIALAFHSPPDAPEKALIKHGFASKWPGAFDRRAVPGGRPKFSGAVNRRPWSRSVLRTGGASDSICAGTRIVRCKEPGPRRHPCFRENELCLVCAEGSSYVPRHGIGPRDPSALTRRPRRRKSSNWPDGCREAGGTAAGPRGPSQRHDDEGGLGATRHTPFAWVMMMFPLTRWPFYAEGKKPAPPP